MPVKVTLQQVMQLAPKTLPAYQTAFSNGQSVLDQYGISETPLRVAHFMAQILLESGAFTCKEENLNYSKERLPVVWSSRFKPKGPLDPAAYEHNATKLANEVYGGKNGNTDPGDGYAYRGRGLLQLTGKGNYKEVAGMLRQKHPEAPDFVVAPDEVGGAEWSLAVAAAKWFATNCNALADSDDVTKVTKAINGGTNGIEERKAWLVKTKAVWKS